MAKIDFLKKRADGFLRGAKYHLREGDYNIAAFHLEQACQLHLKYYIFLKIADFPKTHSIQDLLSDIGKVYKRENEVVKFQKENIQLISDLEQAYITSRYFPVEFGKLQVQNMEKFVKSLFEFLRGL